MTDIAFQTFTDPDSYYGAIRNSVEGVVTARGDYHVEFTRVDFNRLWMSHGGESLARVSTYTPRWDRTTILFATIGISPPRGSPASKCRPTKSQS